MMVQAFRLSVDDIEHFKKDICFLLRQSFKKSFPGRGFTEDELISRIEKAKEYVLADKAVIYGAKHDEKLVGFVWFFSKTDGTQEVVHINHFAVLEGYRGMGLGSSLLKCVESFVRESRAKEIELIVTASNKSAVGFYLNKGFSIERFVMRKRLT